MEHELPKLLRAWADYLTEEVKVVPAAIKMTEAAKRIEELEANMEEAMNHAAKAWKENGMKTDDQLGVVALILAVGLGLTDKKDAGL